MVNFLSMRNDVKKAIEYGQIIRINHYNASGSVTNYDDDKTLTVSGNSFWTSGLIMPLNTAWQSSNDAILMQQGKVKTGDKKIYVVGDTETSQTMKIGIGSPVTECYSIIPDGVLAYPPAGTIVYKTLYCRYLSNGSLIGEM